MCLYLCICVLNDESVRGGCASARPRDGADCAALCGTAITDRIALTALQFAASKAAPALGNFSVAAAHPLGQVTSGRPHRATKAVLARNCKIVINGQAARPTWDAHDPFQRG